MSDTKKTQRLIAYIADEVVRICEEHDIQYFILGGTLLGAVRHKGFIPWDDDLDFGMLRKDYEKFLQICSKELDKSIFFLQTFKTDKFYAHCMAKVQLLGTKIIEDFSITADIHHGIFVDIFPYDNLPDGKLIRKCFLFRNHFLKTLLWIKCNYGIKEHASRPGYKVLRFVGKFVSVENLKARIDKLIIKYNGKECQECFSSDYPNEILKKYWLVEPSDYEFEGRTYKGIREYDKYLTALYGDYMKLPPEEDRVTHTTCAVDYGKYQ